MREIAISELELVNGGNPILVGVAAGAATGWFGAYWGGGNSGNQVAGALLGGVAGLYGAAGLMVEAIAAGFASTIVSTPAASSGGTGTGSSGGQASNPAKSGGEKLSGDFDPYQMPFIEQNWY